ncbi:MAG: hypothetical protein QXU67_04330, partial [Candidatus Bathyarchaeia archaeon]
FVDRFTYANASNYDTLKMLIRREVEKLPQEYGVISPIGGKTAGRIIREVVRNVNSPVEVAEPAFGEYTVKGVWVRSAAGELATMFDRAVVFDTPVGYHRGGAKYFIFYCVRRGIMVKYYLILEDKYVVLIPGLE